MKRVTSKIIALSIGTMFLMSMLAIPPAEASKSSYILHLIKTDKKQLAKIARDIPMSNTVAPIARLSKKLNIPQHLLTSPAVRKMVVVGEDIESHGAFASKMLNNSSIPEQVIRQYSRYGKSHYLDVAESVSKTMTSPSKSRITAALSKLAGKYKGMNKVINKFNAGKYDDDIFVRNIRKGRKQAWNTFSWLAAHPKAAMAGVATAWYLTDPEGFEDTLHQSGQSIGAFVTDSMVSVSAGVGEGVSTGVIQGLGGHSITAVIGGGLIIMLVLLAFFVKTFRRLLLFPFRLFGIKANAKMDDMEQQSRGTAQAAVRVNSMPKSSVQATNQHKPRSNL